MDKIIEMENEDTLMETSKINNLKFADKSIICKENVTQTDDLKGSEFDAESKSVISNSKS